MKEQIFATLGDQFPEFFSNISSTKVSVEASQVEVVKKQACTSGKHNANKYFKNCLTIQTGGKRCAICNKKGKVVDNVFMTFVEVNLLKAEYNKTKVKAREQAVQAFKVARSISNVDKVGNLVSYKPTMRDFEKENKIAKVHRNTYGQRFSSLPDGTEFAYPMATEEELIAFDNKKSLPSFSLLR